MKSNERILIIGIGNEYRTDDAVGLHVARQLASLAPPNCDIKELPGEGSQVMNAWQGYRYVILIDAVRSTAAPGTIVRVDASNEDLPDNWVHHSAHTVSLHDAINLARILSALPDTLLIFGIEGVNFEPGPYLTEEVHKAADRLADLILDEIKSRQSR